MVAKELHMSYSSYMTKKRCGRIALKTTIICGREYVFGKHLEDFKKKE